MRRRLYFLFLAALLFPVLGRAQILCPWINRATATDSPDGVIREGRAAVADGGSQCSFSYSEGDVAYDVQVTVRNTPDGDQPAPQPETRCTSAKTSLTGIGNEAFLCSADTRHIRGEQVVGRVRDKMFLVVVSAKESRKSTVGEKVLSDKATLIAEQVVGNLF